MADEDATVLVRNDGGVRTLTLNRPTVLNAFSGQLLAELRATVREAAEDESVRCVVITGAGRGFCSGLDLAEYAGSLEGDEPIDLEGRLRDQFNPMIADIRTMEKPVVSSVNGAAAGAGCSLALACDMRIAGESAVFVQAFVNIGLIPDCGSTFTLPRLVGMSRAMELTMTGRKVPAAEALDLGLVNRVVADNDLSDETKSFAGQLASLPTRAIGMTKRLINAAWTNDLQTQLELEAQLQMLAMQTQDHREGLQAFFQKRAPSFLGR